MKSKPIFFFPHLPKTGGASFLQNAERSFPLGTSLRVNCNLRQFYIHPQTKNVCFYENEEDFKYLIDSLSETEKTQIRFASGHDLPYGIHERFPQPAQYFLFVREPIARTISLYNYQRSQHEFLKNMKNMDESHRRLKLFSQKWFLLDGKVPSFEDWLEQSYNRDYYFYFTMTRTLQYLNYMDPCITENSWDALMKKFFFIGLTETLDEDELYLYHKIGIRRFWASRNASHPYISYKNLDKATQEKIREKNLEDFILYEYAKKANLKFKKQEMKFPKIVSQMKFKKNSYYLLENFLKPTLDFFRAVRKQVLFC